MIITAKFASTCPCCSLPVAVGAQVEWSKGSKAVHVACSGKPSAQATSPRSAYRRGVASARAYGWDGVQGSASYYSSGRFDDES